jgi:hypothetical protein
MGTLPKRCKYSNHSESRRDRKLQISLIKERWGWRREGDRNDLEIRIKAIWFYFQYPSSSPQSLHLLSFTLCMKMGMLPFSSPAIRVQILTLCQCIFHLLFNKIVITM